MNTPEHCSDDTINRLVELDEMPAPRAVGVLLNPEPLVPAGIAPAFAEMQALHVHPDESLVEVFQALIVGGFRIYAVPDHKGDQQLCVAKPWRIDSIRKRVADDARRAAMTSRELAEDNAAIARQSAINEEMSRS